MTLPEQGLVKSLTSHGVDLPPNFGDALNSQAILSTALISVFRGKFCDFVLANRKATTFSKHSVIYDVGERSRTFFFICGPWTGGKVVAVESGRPHRKALARSGQAGLGPRASRPDLRLVHRGFRHARSERGKSLTRRGHRCARRGQGLYAVVHSGGKRQHDCALHGFWVARSLYGANESGAPPEGAGRPYDRSFCRRPGRQSEGIGLLVSGLCRMVCGRDGLSLRCRSRRRQRAPGDCCRGGRPLVRRPRQWPVRIG